MVPQAVAKLAGFTIAGVELHHLQQLCFRRFQVARLDEGAGFGEYARGLLALQIRQDCFAVQKQLREALIAHLAVLAHRLVH